jgi:hypothetical protein
MALQRRQAEAPRGAGLHGALALLLGWRDRVADFFIWKELTTKGIDMSEGPTDRMTEITNRPAKSRDEALSMMDRIRCRLCRWKPSSLDYHLTIGKPACPTCPRRKVCKFP